MTDLAAGYYCRTIVTVKAAMGKSAKKIHVLRVLDARGDTQMNFDPQNPAEVADVEMRFRELMGRGFAAFDVSTMPGRVMRTFDPQASEVIVTPRFAGG